MKYFNRDSANKFYPVLTFGLSLGLAIGYSIVNGLGHAIDWRDFRLWALGLPHEQGVWNPYWAKLTLLPIAWLPQNMGHLILNSMTIVAILFVQQFNILPLFSKYVHVEMWYGNLDGFVIIGIIMCRLLNPYWVGAGLFLISMKPQFLPLALFYVVKSRDIRLLIIPLIGFLLSLLFLGNWLPEWFALMPPTPKPEVNVSLFPWALPVWFLFPFAKDKERFVLAATALTMPYFNVLSLIAFFAFLWPTWVMLIIIAGSWLKLNTVVIVVALLYALFWEKSSLKNEPKKLSEILGITT